MPNFSLDVRAAGFAEAAAGAGRAASSLEGGLRPAMEESVRLVQRGFEGRSPSGPGHFGGKHLRDSYRTAVTGRGTTVTGHVWTALPQGRWLEGGTKDHEIAPRRRRALKIGDRYASRAKVRGVGAHFIKETVAREVYPAITARFSELANLAIRMLKVY